MTSVNYGLIGFGGIAEGRIAPEGFALDQRRFEPLREAKLIAATSRSDRRRSAAEAMGLRWYESVEDLLGAQEIDAVFIASNNASHYREALAAIDAGKHLLMDKPITTSLEEARKIQSEAKRRGLSLSVNQMMDHNVFNEAARESIASGRIGSVGELALHLEFGYGSSPEEAASWRCSRPEERGGPIGDVGSHCLYMAEFLLGSRIARLGCAFAPKTLDIAVESGAMMRFETESGVSGRIRVAFDAGGRSLESTLLGCGYEAYGSKGILRGYGTLGQLSGHEDEPVSLRVELDDFVSSQPVRVAESENIYAAVVREHAQSVLNGAPMDGEDAIHNLELILAAYDSAERGGEMIDMETKA